MAVVGSYAWKREMVRRRRAVREERERMEAAGYRKHETDWEIHRGARWRERIIDAVVSQDGLYVWTKLGPANETGAELQTKLQTGPQNQIPENPEFGILVELEQ